MILSLPPRRPNALGLLMMAGYFFFLFFFFPDFFLAEAGAAFWEAFLAPADDFFAAFLEADFPPPNTESQ